VTSIDVPQTARLDTSSGTSDAEYYGNTEIWKYRNMEIRKYGIRKYGNTEKHNCEAMAILRVTDPPGGSTRLYRFLSKHIKLDTSNQFIDVPQALGTRA